MLQTSFLKAIRRGGVTFCCVTLRPLLGAMCFVLACGGASSATQNSTFYDWSLGDGAQQFEQAVPELNWPRAVEEPAFVGVAILHRSVHLSRPSNWIVRNASNHPDEPFIHYISPNAYSFAVYRRRDPAEDSWAKILERFGEDVATKEAVIVGEPVPMAVGRGQGRVLSVRREVPSARHPYSGKSRELLVRDGDEVILVQIVYDSDDLSDVDMELLRAIGTLQLK